MAKQQGDALFEESSRGKVGFGKILAFVIGFVLFMGGIVVMSYGFSSQFTEQQQLWVFVAGLTSTFLGFAVTFGGSYASTVKIK